MIRACCLLFAILATANSQAATLSVFAAGFANATPGFWGIEYPAGQTDQVAVSSVLLRSPGPGFFDFDGIDNYAGQTAPIFDTASSLGLSPGDVSLTFTGVHPTEITINFGPGTLRPGDRLQFAADIDNLGSE